LPLKQAPQTLLRPPSLHHPANFNKKQKRWHTL
jgi:hypothetical protein